MRDLYHPLNSCGAQVTARKHADDVLVYDNTPDGKGHRLVARFIAGELVRMTHSSPDWLKRFFGRELRGQDKQLE